jgi:TP901 family phage tail tape measure protein
MIESAITELIRTEEELAKQTKDTADQGSFLSSAFRTVGTVVTAAGAAIGATVTAVGALVQATTAAVVETDNYAQAVGISTEAMQAFDFAAQRVGGDTDALRESLRTSQDAVAQFVNDGTGPAAEALERFGLQLTDSSGKVRSMEQLLPELTTALGNIQDPAERTRLAIQLFGEEDSRVMLALANNPTILTESATALEKYGLVMGKDLVQQSRTFQTGVTDLMASLQGLAQELVTALLPTINALLPQFTAWVVSLRESDTVQKELIPTLKSIIESLGSIGVAVDVLKIGWAALNAGFNAAVMVILEGVGKIAQGLGTVITAAGTAADVLGMDGVAAKLKSAGTAVTAVGNEADKMGDIARENMEEYQKSIDKTIANLVKTTTTTQQTTTATQELGQAATQAGKEVTSATKAMAEETERAQQQAKALKQAYQELGIEVPKATRQAAVQAIEAFRTIATSGTASLEELQDYYTDTVVPTIEAATGRLAPAFDQVMGQIDERLRTTNAHLGSNTRDTIELINGFWTNMRVTASEALENTGSLSDRILRQTRQNVTDTLGPVSQLVKDLGITTQQESRKMADAAIEDFQLLVTAFGIRSEEVKHGSAALIKTIEAGYDELPPYVRTVMSHVVGANQDGADASAEAHRQGTELAARYYNDLGQEISATMARLTDQLNRFSDSSEIRFGTTLEELQSQAAYYRRVIDNLSITQLGSAYQGVRESFQRTLNEINQRIRELREEDAASTGITDRFTDSLTGVGSAAQETAGSLDSVGASASRSRNEVTALAQQLQATLGITEEWLALYGSRYGGQPAGQGGGTAAGIGGGVGRSGRGGFGGGDSITIGMPPGSLPPGVRLPSELGLPEGGVSYSQQGSQGRAMVTNNTIVNVNEPITIQTRADTSALTEQAVMDVFNNAVRRGILRPELGSGLSGRG